MPFDLSIAKALSGTHIISAAGWLRFEPPSTAPLNASRFLQLLFVNKNSFLLSHHLLFYFFLYFISFLFSFPHISFFISLFFSPPLIVFTSFVFFKLSISLAQAKFSRASPFLPLLRPRPEAYRELGHHRSISSTFHGRPILGSSIAEKFRFGMGHFFDPFFPFHENWLAFDKEGTVKDTTNRSTFHIEGFMIEDEPANAVMSIVINTNRGRIARGDFPPALVSTIFSSGQLRVPDRKCSWES